VQGFLCGKAKVALERVKLVGTLPWTPPLTDLNAAPPLQEEEEEEEEEDDYHQKHPVVE